MAAGGKDTDTVVLVSSDGVRFEITKDEAKLSGLVKTMIEDEEGDADEEVPLMDVKGNELKKVVEYLKYHATVIPPEIEKPLKSTDMHQVVPKWDADFIDLDQNTLFEVVLAANYMDIQPLLNLGCAKVASMLKDKTPEEIRKTFNIRNDFTPEEEAQIREENKWIEE